MMGTLKKLGVATVLATTLIAGGAGAAYGQTVYYKGKAVSWTHGRKAIVKSYSTVQTGYFKHSATANTTFSGWKKPGVTAHAEQYVGTGRATAYWACK
jgi:hypothetical protein